MKIFVNDILKEEVNINNDNIEETIRNIINQLIPEIDLDKIVFDDKSKKITYLDNDKNINVELGVISNQDEKSIYLTTTEIRMILRKSSLPINEEMVDRDTITTKIENHIPEAGNKVLELHTHFIEVLDGKTFFEILVEGDPYFKDSDDNEKYNIYGKSYTKEELINALEYPLEHLSGIEKDSKGIKSLAFSKLSEIIALRTNILKRNPKAFQSKSNGQDKSDSNNDIGYRYGIELTSDSKCILIARIRELFIASLLKLENEGVNYVELSYSRSDISKIFDMPMEPRKPIRPKKEECEDFESELKKYEEEYTKYEVSLKIYSQDKENYENFMKKLKEIQARGKIDFRFLLSTQRDEWRKSKMNIYYCVPSSSEKIISNFLNKLINKKEIEQERIIKELVEHFIRNIDKEKFKKILKKRIDSLRNVMNKNKVQELSNIIESIDISNSEVLFLLLKEGLKKIEKKPTRSLSTILLYNILCEDLSFIQESQIDLSGLFDSESFKSRHIVGYDIMGYETKMSNAEKIYLEEKIKIILQDYSSTDAKSGYSDKRIIRIHAGETRESSGNVLYILRMIKKIKNDSEFKTVMNNFEFRIGHGVFIFDEKNQADEVIRLLIELGIIVEVNFSSNYALDNVDEITDVPIQKFRKGTIIGDEKKKVKYVVSTDGGGVYKTTVIQEGLLEHRYFPDSNNEKDYYEPMIPDDNSSSTESESPTAQSTESDRLFTDKKIINEVEDPDNLKLEEKVLNEYKNLIYIFYKDFSIDNILNFSEISSKMGDIEKNINDGDFIKAQFNIISCQILMNIRVNFKESLEEMKKEVISTRKKIYHILNEEENKYDNKICAISRLVTQMSDKDLLVNFNDIFEKNDLNKLLSLYLKNPNYLTLDSSVNKKQIHNLATDVDSIFLSKAKYNFTSLDENTIYKTSNNLMLKEGEDKLKYIDSLFDIIKAIIESNDKKLSKLRSTLLSKDLRKLRYDLETRPISEINEIVRELLVYNKTGEELTSILSLHYRSIIESGTDISINEYIRGEYENDRKFKK